MKNLDILWTMFLHFKNHRHVRVKKEFPLNMNGGGTRLGSLAIAAGSEMHSEPLREAVLYRMEMKVKSTQMCIYQYSLRFLV